MNRKSVSIGMIRIAILLVLGVYGTSEAGGTSVEFSDSQIESIVRRSYQYVAMYNVDNKNEAEAVAELLPYWRAPKGTTTLDGVLAMSVIGAVGLSSQVATTPLWAHVPDTISPAWGPFIAEKGKTRTTPFPAPDDIAAWKEIQDRQAKTREAKADEIAKHFNVTYKESKIGGVPVVEVTPASLATKDKIAVYCHGGAYVLNSAKGMMFSMGIFADATGLKVIGIDYTLAPHSKWQETTDEVLAVFKALKAKGYDMAEIVLYGDSAGAGLAPGATLKMRDQGLGMPAALVLWSPWADISETGDTRVTLRDAEPYYTYKHVLGPSALAYADKKDHKHPYVSPVYGDFSIGFPPTLIQGGTKEIFLSDFVRLYQALDQAGQTVKLDIYEGMPHVHPPTLPDTPESKAAMKKVKAWVAEHLLGDSGTASKPVPTAGERVTVENFARAESDTYFRGNLKAYSIGVGELNHNRVPITPETTTVIRENQDTLYSGIILDLSRPVRFTLPETDGRFMSMHVVNQDHYMFVKTKPGTYDLTEKSVGTRFALVIIWTFANPNDPEDVKKAHAAQDGIKVEGGGKGPFEAPDWDQESLATARSALSNLAALGFSADYAFGRKEETKPVDHLIGAAAGWAGQPRSAAMYDIESVPENDGRTPYSLTAKDVPVDAFWSVTVYNKDGFLEKNDLRRNSFNNYTAKPNADGSFTIHFGGDPKAINHLPITPGWNYVVRMYQPRKEILEGSWTFPKPEKNN